MGEWVLVSDVGSTTTKVLAFRETAGRLRLEGWVQEPTTVEAPDEDVMVGLVRALDRLGRALGCTFVAGSPGPPSALAPPFAAAGGCIPDEVHLDRSRVRNFLSSSSAGGGLRILACGATLGHTAAVARRVALGAGGLILDTIAADDGRPLFEKFSLVRSLRPDMILMAGGVDGGNVAFALELMDLLNAARPVGKFGKDFRIPLVFAGNVDAGPLVQDSASDCFMVHVVPNVQPTLDRENPGPARQAIQELFMTHVMAHAPGYDRLAAWVDAPVLPTPGAVSRLLELVARQLRRAVLAVDVGGATTDVYSGTDAGVVRTVAANVGMSYSAPNVLAEVGREAISRWLPEGLGPADVEDWVAAKGVYPCLVPHYPENLLLDHALAREAIRLAVRDHLLHLETRPEARVAARPPRGRAPISWRDGLLGATLVVGSGGVLSHAPSRAQAAGILVDALLPVGVVELAVDSVFMMPHLGVLSQLSEGTALDLFFTQCLVPLGTVIAPAGDPGPEGSTALAVRGSTLPSGRVEVAAGDLVAVPLGPEAVEVVVEPAAGLDAGAGAGRRLAVQVKGGAVGLILDGRGRPLRWPPGERRGAAVGGWLRGLGARYRPE